MSNGVDTANRAASVPLTVREREIAALVSDGLTNAEISDRLGITFATAKWHVSQVLAKLDAARREDVGGRLEALAHTPRRSRDWARRSAIPFLKGFGLAKGLGIAAAVIPVGAIAVAGVLVLGSRGVAPGVDSRDALTVAAESPTSFIPAPAAGVVTPPPSAHNCTPSLAPPMGSVPAADHSGCDLRGFHFGSAMLNGADFSDALLDGAIFEGATLGGANLRGASLRGTRFVTAILQRTNFDGADLAGAQFTDSIATGATFRGAICPDGLPAIPRGGTCIGTPGLDNLPTTRSLAAARTQFGQAAPDFALADAHDPDSFRRLADYAGKYLVLWWYGSWCGSCEAQATQLQSAAERHPEIAFVALNLRDEADVAMSLMAGVAPRVPVLLDSSGATAAAYGVISVPATVVIDPNGIYKSMDVPTGFLRGTELEDLLLRSGAAD